MRMDVTYFLSHLEKQNCKYAFYYKPIGGAPTYHFNHQRFYSASMIKVPILLAWLYLERAGEANRTEICNLDAEPQVQGAGFSWLLHARQIPYQDVLLMMIALSDNLCTNLVIRRVGLDRLAGVIREELDLPGAELQRKLFDYDARARGLDNWITAEACIRMYTLIEALPADQRAWVDSILAVNQDNALLKRSVPRDTLEFYHKTGSIEGVLHDWGYTKSCQIFLLTQNVAAEPPVFDVFGELGGLLLPTP